MARKPRSKTHKIKPVLQAAIDKYFGERANSRSRIARQEKHWFRLGWEAAEVKYGILSNPAPPRYRDFWIAGYKAEVKNEQLEHTARKVSDKPMEFLKLTRVVNPLELADCGELQTVPGKLEELRKVVDDKYPGGRGEYVFRGLWIDLLDGNGDLVGDPVILDMKEAQWALHSFFGLPVETVEIILTTEPQTYQSEKERLAADEGV